MGNGLITFVILALLGTLIFSAVLPSIADSTVGIQNTGNITGASSVMVGLILLIVVIGFILLILKTSGIDIGV